MNNFVAEVHSLGGQLVSVSSQADVSVERIKKATGAFDQEIISDYDKHYASAYKLLKLWTDHPEHKDQEMSQPAIFVLNSDAELVFEWRAEKPGPLGRPEPAQLVQGVLAAVKQCGPKFNEQQLAARLSSLSYGGLISFVNSMMITISKIGLHQTMSQRFGPEWPYMMFYKLYKEGVYSVFAAHIYQEVRSLFISGWVYAGLLALAWVCYGQLM